MFQIALGIYPATISILGKTVRTEIRGWCWRSFCQTLSASEDEFGGVENYVRCHLTVTKLLDYASEIGVLRDVFDETGFWIDRNLEALGESPAKWNEQVERMAEDMRRLMEDE